MPDKKKQMDCFKTFFLNFLTHTTHAALLTKALSHIHKLFQVALRQVLLFSVVLFTNSKLTYRISFLVPKKV